VQPAVDVRLVEDRAEITAVHRIAAVLDLVQLALENMESDQGGAQCTARISPGRLDPIESRVFKNGNQVGETILHLLAFAKPVLVVEIYVVNDALKRAFIARRQKRRPQRRCSLRPPSLTRS
jgi:hypothetical protein